MKKIFLLSVVFIIHFSLQSQESKPDWLYGFPDACTSITVGKSASTDGSVFTSHTDDSHRTRSWMDIKAAKNHSKNTTTPMFKRSARNDLAMPAYKHEKIGEIPQIEHTFQYMNTAYPCINEHQLAIGESTFGGREILQSDNGLIDCQRLCQLMLERTTTARDAIELAGNLLEKHGWNDYGECLTIADKNEVWHFEVVGPGKGKTGAIWAAQRVPDDHVSCNVNASTIKHIDISQTNYFMASENIYEMALDSGWCLSKEDFQFCYAYAPESRTSFASRRREWRIFDLLAPSLKLDPNSENYPFSVKPDKKVNIEKLITIFKDYFEHTPYDMTRNITATDNDGKTIVSPLANPFMPYDQLGLHNVNGDWFHVDKKTNHIRFLGERTIARWYTMYATIIQCRNWLPDEIGGVVWLAQDNVATSIYVPFYCSVTDVPESYKTPGRVNGYTKNSAWWAFNRLGTLTAQRWGEARYDVDATWQPLQNELLQNQNNIEKQALKLLKNEKTSETIKLLTDYGNKQGEKMVKIAWQLGDDFWTKYDEKF